MMRLIRSPVVTWRRLPRAVVLALPGGDAPMLLNTTGAMVWDLLVEAASDRDIAASLGASCGVSPGEVAVALAPLLGELVERGAVLEVTVR